MFIWCISPFQVFMVLIWTLLQCTIYMCRGKANQFKHTPSFLSQAAMEELFCFVMMVSSNRRKEFELHQESSLFPIKTCKMPVCLRLWILESSFWPNFVGRSQENEVSSYKGLVCYKTVYLIIEAFNEYHKSLFCICTGCSK